MRNIRIHSLSGLRISLLGIFLLCLIPLTAQKQIGRPLINNYSYQDYEGAPINWWVLEDNNGIMYFANNIQILQYDGVNWTGIDMNNGCRSLAIDADGVIYAGGIGDLGYLKPGDTGELEFVSMVDELPEEHRAFEDIWFIHYHKDKMYFWAEFKVFIWDGNQMEVVVSEEGLHVSAIVDDKQYIRIWNVGLCVLTDDNTFELLPGGEQFAGERIYSILKYDEERILIATRNEGFFLYDGKEFTKFVTEVDPYIKGETYLPGIALDDGSFVINTNNEGAYLMDHDGRLLQKYTTETGLQEGSVLNTFLDSRGVLWLPLFNGISNVNLNSSFTTVDANMGISTTVFGVIRHKGILYLTTNGGIYYLDESDMMVKPIEGTYGQGGNFFEFRDRLYVATNGMGLIEISGTTFKDVRRDDNYDFRAGVITQAKSDPNRIYVNYNMGLKSFYFDETANQFREESNTNKFVMGNGVVFEKEDGSLCVDTSSDGEIINIIP